MGTIVRQIALEKSTSYHCGLLGFCQILPIPVKYVYPEIWGCHSGSEGKNAPPLSLSGIRLPVFKTSGSRYPNQTTNKKNTENVRSKNIKVFVSNANSKIKQVLEKMDFIEHLGADYYQDSKESMASIISKYYIT